MIQPVANHLCHSVTPERVEAVRQFGFTERQARFLAHVMVFSGVFLERQYRAFTGLAHGQKTHDFLTKLVTAGYATSITPGALHRGRLFHVQFKPLYEAIGEPNNRHRRPASLGRLVERMMLLDAVLADRRYGWLGTERDKLTYFREALREDKLADYFYPHVTFGTGVDTTTRFFPDKLPIGVPLRCEHRHLFLYLATRENPMAFRVFLLRHGDLLPHMHEWTIRVLLPRRVRKAAALYRYALRDAFMNRVMPHESRSSTGTFGSAAARLCFPCQTGTTTSRRWPGSIPPLGSRPCIACGWNAAIAPSGPCSMGASETNCSAVRRESNSPNCPTSTCSSHRSSAVRAGLRRTSFRQTT